MRSRNANLARPDFQVFPGGQAQDRSLYEQEIEARVERLSRAVEKFVDGLPAALLAEHSATRQLLEELVVKQSSLQWIVRVVKHSEAGVRRRLWADIDRFLTRIEKSFELLARLQQLECHLRVPHESQGSVAVPISTDGRAIASPKPGTWQVGPNLSEEAFSP
jgi:hypothetical protein